jgi:hypothetical protein
LAGVFGDNKRRRSVDGEEMLCLDIEFYRIRVTKIFFSKKRAMKPPSTTRRYSMSSE